MKYVAYYRVSTKKQDLGLDAQKTILRNYLKDSDEVIASFEEKETGTNKKVREELNKALKACKDTGAVLLIAKLDRLARSVSFVSNLMDSGVKFQALDLPEANELTIHIFAALAQHEAKIISERTKAALGELKRQGVQLGKAENFTDAARKKGRAVHVRRARNNPNTRQARAYAELLKENGHNYSQIAEKLNENGYRTARGKEYYPTSAQRLLN